MFGFKTAEEKRKDGYNYAAGKLLLDTTVYDALNKETYDDHTDHNYRGGMIEALTDYMKLRTSIMKEYMNKGRDSDSKEYIALYETYSKDEALEFDKPIFDCWVSGKIHKDRLDKDNED